MPKKVELADGTEIEVPTDEETKAQEDANKKLSEDLSTLKTSLGIEEGEDLTEKLQELKESQNPNWPKIREQLKAAKAKLKEGGLTLDDNGVITDDKAKVDVEAITQAARDAGKKGAEQVLAGQMKERMFGQFTDESERTSVETMFDKLVSSGIDADQSFKLAVGQVFPERKNEIVAEAFNGASGTGPKMAGEKKEGEGFAESDRGKAVAGAMGLDLETNDKK